jgi:hypothetical protein
MDMKDETDQGRFQNECKIPDESEQLDRTRPCLTHLKMIGWSDSKQKLAKDRDME